MGTVSYSGEKPLALITGASSGIGYELARQFIGHGYDLIIVAVGADIYDVAEDLQAMDAHVEAVQADLSTYDGVDKVYASLKSSGRPLEAAAINAGTGVGGYFTDTSLEAELKMIDLNIKSVVHISKHILRDMVARNTGKVLYTASVVSEAPTPFQAVYSGTKAFVLNFAESVRSELKDTDITITALMPGATETDFFHKAGLDDTKVGQSKKDDPADVARDGFKALMAGDDKVIAHSLKSKAMGIAGRLMPDKVTAASMRSMSEPGSAEK